MFNSINEVYDYLYNQRKSARRENLDRINRCVELLNIKINYPVIHITGTNGKGSTGAMIKSILSLTGRHVGFFISPYVISFNERIEVNDRFISNSEIMHYANIVKEFADKYNEEYNDVIPFFELTMLIALMYFEDRKIDVLVLECGLGGLLDATNFIKSNIAIITNVGYDHMAQLGNSLSDIAYHKLGIAKDNVKLITACDMNLMPQFINHSNIHKNDVINVCSDVSDIKVSNITEFKYKNIAYKTNLLGKYQAYNASLAIEACKAFDNTIPYDIVDFGLTHVFWPGRFEVIKKEPLVILDGAHNIHAFNALIDTLVDIKGNKKLSIIYTALVDKDYKTIIESLDTIVDKYYFTTIDDLRKSNPMDLAKCSNKEYEIIPNMEECINTALLNQASDEILLVTGSLHFISLARNILIK